MKKISGPYCFSDEFYQTFKKVILLILHKYFEKGGKETHTKLFY